MYVNSLLQGYPSLRDCHHPWEKTYDSTELLTCLWLKIKYSKIVNILKTKAILYVKAEH